MTPSFNFAAPWIACVPLACYLWALAWAHLRRRPFLVSGVLDAALLALAVSGLAAVGPLASLVPVAGGSPWSWTVLVLLFALCVAVCVLVSRPRLVVYNITVEQFRPLVAEVVAALDAEARWAGESAALPGQGFQLHIEGTGPLRAVSVVNVGERSSPEGWGDFARRLRRAVRGVRVRRSPWGGVFAAAGAAAIIAATWLSLGPFSTRSPAAPGPSVAPAPRRSPPLPTLPGETDAGARRLIGA